MKYIKCFNESISVVDDIYTFKTKQRYTYTTPTGRSMSFPYELFTLRRNDKPVASCVITYPYFHPSINNGTWVIRTSFFPEIFDDKKPNFVMLYDVKSKQTGKGYGKIMFGKLIEYLKTKSIDKIYFDVDVNNESAQRFYDKLGFKVKHKGEQNIRYSLDIK